MSPSPPRATQSRRRPSRRDRATSCGPPDPDRRRAQSPKLVKPSSSGRAAFAGGAVTRAGHREGEGGHDEHTAAPQGTSREPGRAARQSCFGALVQGHLPLRPFEDRSLLPAPPGSTFSLSGLAHPPAGDEHDPRRGDREQDQRQHEPHPVAFVRAEQRIEDRAGSGVRAAGALGASPAPIAP